jgi:hypothetical protein
LSLILVQVPEVRMEPGEQRTTLLDLIRSFALTRTARNEASHRPQTLVVPDRSGDRRWYGPTPRGQVAQYVGLVGEVLLSTENVVATEDVGVVAVPGEPVAVADGVRVGRPRGLEPLDPETEPGGDGVQRVGAMDGIGSFWRSARLRGVNQSWCAGLVRR